MTSDPFFLACLVLLVAWVWREWCHREDLRAWTRERKEWRKLCIGLSQGPMGQYGIIEDDDVPAEERPHKPTKAEIEAQEAADAETSQRLRLEELERERLAQLTADSEAGITRMLGGVREEER